MRSGRYFVVTDETGDDPNALKHKRVPVASFNSREDAVEYMAGDNHLPGYIFNSKGEPVNFVAPVPDGNW